MCFNMFNHSSFLTLLMVMNDFINYFLGHFHLLMIAGNKAVTSKCICVFEHMCENFCRLDL